MHRSEFKTSGNTVTESAEANVPSAADCVTTHFGIGLLGNVSTAVLLKICTALKCDIADIMEVVSDESPVSED